MLSKRLKTVAEMVTKGNIVADIGTDHGYVPIYLVKSSICPRAYAMDIHEGPLEIAKKNIEENGLQDSICTILSDGMEKLSCGMAESVIIAGMGGDLMIDILKRGQNIDGVKELILSPHKRIDLVRKYLVEAGWHIVQEKMVTDAGKFYTVIQSVPGREREAYSDEEYFYGKLLLNEKNPILKEYLEKEHGKFSKVLNTMEDSGSESYSRIEKILERNQKGRMRYDSC